MELATCLCSSGHGVGNMFMFVLSWSWQHVYVCPVMWLAVCLSCCGVGNMSVLSRGLQYVYICLVMGLKMCLCLACLGDDSPWYNWHGWLAIKNLFSVCVDVDSVHLVMELTMWLCLSCHGVSNMFILSWSWPYVIMPFLSRRLQYVDACLVMELAIYDHAFPVKEIAAC